jgi:hypothetical protein
VCYHLNIVLRGKGRHADGDQLVPETKGITPSQTVGPYFAYGLTPIGKYEWNDAFTQPRRSRCLGRTHPRRGQGVRRRRRCRAGLHAEIWQADAQGRFNDPQDKRALPNSSFRDLCQAMIIRSNSTICCLRLRS